MSASTPQYDVVIIGAGVHGLAIAYYLGKHPEQSGAIAQMPPAEAGSAVRQLEATILAGSAVRK